MRFSFALTADTFSRRGKSQGKPDGRITPEGRVSPEGRQSSDIHEESDHEYDNGRQYTDINSFNRIIVPLITGPWLVIIKQ